MKARLRRLFGRAETPAVGGSPAVDLDAVRESFLRMLHHGEFCVRGGLIGADGLTWLVQELRWLPHCRPIVRDTDGWWAVQVTQVDKNGHAFFFITNRDEYRWGSGGPQVGEIVHAHTSHTIIQSYL